VELARGRAGPQWVCVRSRASVRRWAASWDRHRRVAGGDGGRAGRRRRDVRGLRPGQRAVGDDRNCGRLFRHAHASRLDRRCARCDPHRGSRPRHGRPERNARARRPVSPPRRPHDGERPGLSRSAGAVAGARSAVGARPRRAAAARGRGACGPAGGVCTSRPVRSTCAVQSVNRAPATGRECRAGPGFAFPRRRACSGRRRVGSACSRHVGCSDRYTGGDRRSVSAAGSSRLDRCHAARAVRRASGSGGDPGVGSGGGDRRACAPAGRRDPWAVRAHVAAAGARPFTAAAAAPDASDRSCDRGRRRAPRCTRTCGRDPRHAAAGGCANCGTHPRRLIRALRRRRAVRWRSLGGACRGWPRGRSYHPYSVTDLRRSTSCRSRRPRRSLSLPPGPTRVGRAISATWRASPYRRTSSPAITG
jgi:hypothetical protein